MAAGSLRAGLVVLASVVPLLALSPAKGAFPGANDVIVFVSERGFDAQNLWTTAQGAEPRRLTESPDSQWSPAWSPDGRSLAYSASLSREQSGMFVTNVESGRTRQLTKIVSSRNRVLEGLPAWAPDGSRLVFVRTVVFVRTGRVETDLYVMRANGDKRRRLTRTRGGETAPAWSPDGTEIAHVASCPPPRGACIYTIRSDGRGSRRLIARGTRPSWSPDGGKIAFERGPDVFVAGASGNSELRVTRDSLGASSPAWSPDGTMLVVDVSASDDCSPTGAVRRLEFVRPDGGGQRRVFPSTCYTGDFDADWRPRCTLYGTERGDVLNGSPGNDVICALRGNDRIAGYGGDDVIIGGDGRDVIFGGPGTDRLFGSAGGDKLFGTADQDTGRDLVNGGPGRDFGSLTPGLDRSWELERTG
jgi:RTX calcium-binding nonapeptide repeat (4 copies)/WD40-like Beta Propeller Repeat